MMFDSRPISKFRRIQRSATQTVWVYDDFHFTQKPLILLRKIDENQYAVWFIVKPNEYLKETNKLFDNFSDARKYVSKLQREFVLGKLNKLAVENIEGDVVDVSNWNNIKRFITKQSGSVSEMIGDI